jgi:coenzyme F420 hydrogenase subunit beta
MVENALEKVVRGGYCVGCGACRVASNGTIRITRDSELRLEPILADILDEKKNQPRLGEVCPFSEIASDEDAIGNWLYSDLPNHDPRTGWYLSIGAGRIADQEAILKSSSGGLTTWLLGKLLEEKEIDGVVHVGGFDRTDSGELFRFTVSHGIDEVEANRKSQYYSVDFADAILSVRGNGKRYALVGVPCYVKALRLLQQQDPILQDQFRFCVALVCGHMKSPAFAESLAWQVGVTPQHLRRVDFRVKDLEKPADQYSFAAWRDESGPPSVREVRTLFGHNWGQALFQLKSCDFCDDVFGETADVCFGDAWLPAFVQDPRGTNISLVRHHRIAEILTVGTADGAIDYKALQADLVIESQAGNFRHRREGLAVRIKDSQKAGYWIPRKRLHLLQDGASWHRRAIVRIRRKLAERSHTAFREAKLRSDFGYFERELKTLTLLMRIVYRLQRFIR